MFSPASEASIENARAKVSLGICHPSLTSLRTAKRMRVILAIVLLLLVSLGAAQFEGSSSMDKLLCRVMRKSYTTSSYSGDGCDPTDNYVITIEVRRMDNIWRLHGMLVEVLTFWCFSSTIR